MYKKATQKLLDGLKASNRPMVIVKALSIDGTTTTIPVTSGSITVDRTSSDFRRTINFTVNLTQVKRPDGTTVSLVPKNATDPLNIYGNHIYAYRGLVWNIQNIGTALFDAPAPLTDELLRPANEAYELVPLGVFRINSVTLTEETDGQVSIDVQGTDISANIAKNHWTSPTTVWTSKYSVPVTPVDVTPENHYIASTILEAIKLLINDRWPTHSGVFGQPRFDFAGIQDQKITSPIVMGSRTISNSGSNSPWTDISALAAAIGGGIGELFVNAEGAFQIIATPDPNAVSPVWDFMDGDNHQSGGLLTKVTRVLSDAKTVNYVIATGENSTAKTPVKAIATDSDPTSPTYYLGTFGRVVGYEPGRKLLKTQAQVQNAADTYLSWFIGGDDSTTIEGVPNPCLDVNDVIRVRRKSLGIYNASTVVAVLNTNLKINTYTSLPVQPILKDISAGELLTIYTDYKTQNVTISHPAKKGDSTLSVNPFVPVTEFVKGTVINDPNVISNGGAVNYYIDKITIPLDLSSPTQITARERRVGTRKDAIRVAEYSQVNPNQGY
jgi:hypothetical protein